MTQDEFKQDRFIGSPAEFKRILLQMNPVAAWDIILSTPDEKDQNAFLEDIEIVDHLLDE